MRFVFTLVFLAVAGRVWAGGGVCLRYDSKGESHREYWQGMRVFPTPDYSRVVDPRLFVKPVGIVEVQIEEAAPVLGQIVVTFDAGKAEEVRLFVDGNRGSKVRMEIGDYVLPVDLERTFPWAGKVWLQARPLAKARVILDSHKAQEKS